MVGGNQSSQQGAVTAYRCFILEGNFIMKKVFAFTEIVKATDKAEEWN